MKGGSWLGFGQQDSNEEEQKYVQYESDAKALAAHKKLRDRQVVTAEQQRLEDEVAAAAPSDDDEQQQQQQQQQRQDRNSAAEEAQRLRDINLTPSRPPTTPREIKTVQTRETDRRHTFEEDKAQELMELTRRERLAANRRAAAHRRAASRERLKHRNELGRRGSGAASTDRALDQDWGMTQHLTRDTPRRASSREQLELRRREQATARRDRALDQDKDWGMTQHLTR